MRLSFLIQFSRREILRLSESTRRNHIYSRDWKTAMKPAMETAAMVDVIAPAYAWSKTPGNACTNRRHRIQTDQATRVSTPVDLHPSVAGFSGVCRWFGDAKRKLITEMMSADESKSDHFEANARAA